MKKILMLLIVLLAVSGGIVAGGYIQIQHKLAGKPKQEGFSQDRQFEYSKLSRQLIVPILNDGRLDALLIMEIWLELEPGVRDKVFSFEPRLRDEFLQILYRYANEGAFDTDLLSEKTQANLRRDLTAKAQSLLGNGVNAVLINDLQKQNI